ncbi:Aldehyde/histidinol dehydrogenase [Bisporella sp. PMI_857]|nr:Aldehyde/histidinol dehydrogenase [Bisporella sp. PMI_857]
MDLGEAHWLETQSGGLFEQSFDLEDWELQPEQTQQASIIPTPTESLNTPKRRRPRTILKHTATTQPRKRSKTNESLVPGTGTGFNTDSSNNNSGLLSISTLASSSGPVGSAPDVSPKNIVAASPIGASAAISPTVTYNYVSNELVQSKTRVWTLVHDPATKRLLTRVPDSTLAEIQNIVKISQKAHESWRDVLFSKRRAVMLRLLESLRSNFNAIATSISIESGKILTDASSEVIRSLDMIEAACSIPGGTIGTHLVNEATRTHTTYEPLGVCMIVTPFNFPILIALWSIPFAIITGNTVVWKPSERCPSSAMLLAKCFYQADFPPGVFNVIHGGPTAVEKLLSQPEIKAVSFVGSDDAAERVHDHAVATRKRVQADCGSKNHGVIMEDATKDQTLYAIAGSAFGAAGQRCMALSVAVFVGSTVSWIPDLVKISSSLKVGCGLTPGVDLGPLITSASKERVEAIIQGAIEEGATLLLDGRGVTVPEFPRGNFVGPTILTNVQPYMRCYQEEIFGPVLCCMQVTTLAEAIEIVNENKYGNGCTIFTQNPVTAEKFQRKINVGQIGVNVPVLASPGQIPRTGNKESSLGQRNLPGQTGWEFFCMTKTITTLWRDAQ